MGISSTTNRVLFTGDGSSTVFSFPYYFFSNNDLAVYLYDINSSVVTPQTLNTHYTISGNANSQGVYPSGGSVVMNSAFPGSLQIVITRAPSQVQTFALAQNGPINSLALTQQLDYLTTLVQRLQDEVSRCIQIPDGVGTPSNGAFNTTLPQGISNLNSANNQLIVNSGANGFALLNASTSAQAFTGTLAIANGGTGTNTLTQGQILWASTATIVSTLAFSTINLVNSIVSRDAYGNSAFNNVTSGLQTILATGTSTVLLASSPRTQVVIGSSAQSLNLPDATTLSTGMKYIFKNGTNATININNVSGGLLNTVVAGSYAEATCTNNSSSTGLWDIHYFFPSQMTTFGLNGLPLATGSSVSGSLPVVNGGTAGSSGVQALINLWPPTITRGDILIVGSGAVVNRLAVGSDGQVLTANSSAANSNSALWQSPGSVSQTVVSKTAAYQMTTSDDFVLVSSSVFTVTLPDATTATKKIYRVTKTDSPLAQITLAGSGVQTIGSFGNSVSLWTQNETWEIFPDGSNWQISQHRAISATANLPVSYDNFGTATNNNVFYRRFGDRMEVWGASVPGVTTAALAAVNIPTVVIDSSKIGTTFIGQPFMGQVVGSMHIATAGANNVPGATVGPWPMIFDGSSVTKLFIALNTSGNTFSKANATGISNGSGNPLSFSFNVPILNWQP